MSVFSETPDSNILEDPEWKSFVEELGKKVYEKQCEIEEKFREAGWYDLIDYFEMNVEEVDEKVLLKWTFNKEKFNKDFTKFLEELDKE